MSDKVEERSPVVTHAVRVATSVLPMRPWDPATSGGGDIGVS